MSEQKAGCKLSDYKSGWFDGKYQEGDVFKFEMPGFCSGDYSFTVVGDVLVGAPAKVFDGCRGFTILRDGNVIFADHL